MRAGASPRTHRQKQLRSVVTYQSSYVTVTARDGRPLEFSNIDMSCGFKARYADTALLIATSRCKRPVRVQVRIPPQMDRASKHSSDTISIRAAFLT
jgi:hypothetical protein